MKTKFILLSLAVYMFSCNNNNQTNKLATVSDSSKIVVSDHLLLATLWYQKSAENRAMYYQCYNFAKLALDNQLKSQKNKTKNAVVLDIDETVLNNSPYQVMLIQKGLSYSPQTWKKWSKLAQAKALPGAVEFTNYAKSKGVEVFFVSNRDEDEKDATIKNLANEKFPFVDEKHIFFRVNKESNKIPRYDIIAQDYKILLFVGDNLRDFEEFFANREKDYGFNQVDSIRNQFGENFILLPNPMYGEWEKAIYGGKYPADNEKNKLLKQALTCY